jgi:hypothetical protein
VTFKDLQKLVQSEATQDRVKYFKDSRIESCGYGTKNDTNRKTEQPKAFAASITLLAYQEKTVKRKTLFDYELLLYKALFDRGYLNSAPSSEVMYPFRETPLGKEATGLGVIEFMLRFMAWLCLRNDDYRGS